jgi:hypothetical protein
VIPSETFVAPVKSAAALISIAPADGAPHLRPPETPKLAHQGIERARFLGRGASPQHPSRTQLAGPDPVSERFDPVQLPPSSSATFPAIPA